MAPNDYGDERFVNLVNSTPESLDTLKELADALRTNSNFSTIVATEIGKKVARLSIDDKVITYTRGDSTSDTITTQDYRVKTEAKTTTDKVYLAGTTSSSETVGTLKIDEGIYIDNVSGKLHVTTIEAANVTSSVSGNASTATIAERLSSSAGNATQPVYFANGIPVSTTYALNKTVPSDAKFTDTTYNEFTTASVSTSGSSGLVPAPPKRNDEFTRYLDESGNWTVPVYAGNGLEGTINFEDDGDYGQYQIDVAFDGNGNANTVAHSDHTHNYAGSSSAGGAATSANKLNTNAGNGTQPVYFANGVPVATTYSLNKSVPSDAKFTDTTYDVFKSASSNAAGSSGLVPAPSAGDQTKFLRADKTWTAITPTLIGASASNHTHNYAGSSSSGGPADSANKLNTNAGSSTQPVYFANGVPVVCAYTLGKSVPSDAEFTDTNTTYGTFGAASANTAGSIGLVPAPSAGDQSKFLRADKTWTAITPTLIGASASNHTHNYAGSSSSGGPADSANKLNTNAGNATQPVYFANGVPVACTYTLSKSVPSDAVFTDTDTNTWRPVQNNLTSTSTTDSLSAAQGKVLNDGKVSKSGDTMTGVLYASVRTAGTVDANYYHRNIAYGTTETPTVDATYGGSGSIYIFYT